MASDSLFCLADWPSFTHGFTLITNSTSHINQLCPVTAPILLSQRHSQSQCQRNTSRGYTSNTSSASHVIKQCPSQFKSAFSTTLTINISTWQRIAIIMWGGMVVAPGIGLRGSGKTKSEPRQVRHFSWSGNPAHDHYFWRLLLAMLFDF